MRAEAGNAQGLTERVSEVRVTEETRAAGVSLSLMT
jgi:hypothetical protein